MGEATEIYQLRTSYCYSVIWYTFTMHLFSRKGDGDDMLIFDIGSGSVGGAVVALGSGAKPILRYTVRMEFPQIHEGGATRLVSRMLRTLSQVVLAVTHEGLQGSRAAEKTVRVSESLVVLAAPWTASQTHTLHLEIEKPLTVTRDVFSALLAEHEKTRAAPHLALRGAHELAPIEETLLESSINGYPTERPFGKSGRAVSFSLFSSVAPRRVTDQIGDTIAHSIVARRERIHSFSLALFAVARDLFSAGEEFLPVDLGNEQTEVGIVKSGVLEEVATIPFGRGHILRALDSAGNLGAATSAAFLKLLAEERGAGPHYERAAAALKGAAAEWNKKFRHSLLSFGEQWFLPRRIFLTADDDVVPLLPLFFPKNRDDTATLISAPVELTALDSAALLPHLEVAPSLPRDSFLELETLFVARLSSAPAVTGVR